MDGESIAGRHQAAIDRLVELARADSRIAAAWLQGSRADGSADDFSDIDFYVAVHDGAFEGFDRLAFVSQAGQVLIHLEPFPGATACLLEGPVKLDFFAERLAHVGDLPRPAAAVLVDKTGVASLLRTGWEPDDGAIARQLDQTLRMTYQGALWPVRLLCRESWATYAYSEMMLITATIVPLLLVQRDRRAFARNAMSRERLLTEDEQRHIDELTDATTDAVSNRSLEEAYRAHLRLCEAMDGAGRAACAQYGIEFPEAAAAEALRFFKREWPQ